MSKNEPYDYKIRLSDLSGWLKFAVISSWAIVGLFLGSFLIDFIKILFGVY